MAVGRVFPIHQGAILGYRPHCPAYARRRPPGPSVTPLLRRPGSHIMVAGGWPPVASRSPIAPSLSRPNSTVWSRKPARWLLGTLEIQAQALNLAGIPHRLAVGRCPADPSGLPFGALPDWKTGNKGPSWYGNPLGDNSATRRFFRGRHGRTLREYLAAYALITPALLLIFTFGIFPVAFAVHASLHKWLIVRDEFTGLGKLTLPLWAVSPTSAFSPSGWRGWSAPSFWRDPSSGRHPPPPGAAHGRW